VAQIEKLTHLLADARKSLITAKSEPVTVENRSRDPQRLYEENKPIAVVRDPKIELDKKKLPSWTAKLWEVDRRSD